jgi:hypothetical protein
MNKYLIVKVWGDLKIASPLSADSRESAVEKAIDDAGLRDADCEEKARRALGCEGHYYIDSEPPMSINIAKVADVVYAKPPCDLKEQIDEPADIKKISDSLILGWRERFIDAAFDAMCDDKPEWADKEFNAFSHDGFVAYCREFLRINFDNMGTAAYRLQRACVDDAMVLGQAFVRSFLDIPRNVVSADIYSHEILQTACAALDKARTHRPFKLLLADDLIIISY